MSITSEINRINTNIANAYTSISNKGGTLPETQNSANLADAIDSISTGGGGSTGEKNVKFYDYDGSLVTAYAKDEFLELTQMPANPSHSGLVAQGWNWSLQDAKDYLLTSEVNDRLDIGQMYTTASGLSEFDIALTSSTGLNVTLNLDGTKNWGDGTSDTETTHTYADYGKYTITCNGTTMTTSSSSGLFGQSSSAINYYIKNIRLANITSLSYTAFQACRSLKNITLPISLTSIDGFAFYVSYALLCVIVPKNVTSMANAVFYECQSLACVSLPNGLTGILDNTFQNCCSLRGITIPNSVTTLGANSFNACRSLKYAVISNSITTFGGSVFYNCYSLHTAIFNYSDSNTVNIGKQAFSENIALLNVIMPGNVAMNADQIFDNCYSLHEIKIPKATTSIGQNNLRYCTSCIKYDFTSLTQIPSLYSSAFTEINPIAKIIVPDNLYNTWITTSSWTSKAQYIVRESDYVE